MTFQGWQGIKCSRCVSGLSSQVLPPTAAMDSDRSFQTVCVVFSPLPVGVAVITTVQLKGLTFQTFHAKRWNFHPLFGKPDHRDQNCPWTH
ncbi:hypothetical protein GN956_G19464 [Arapaima gigas]